MCSDPLIPKRYCRQCGGQLPVANFHCGYCDLCRHIAWAKQSNYAVDNFVAWVALALDKGPVFDNPLLCRGYTGSCYYVTAGETSPAWHNLVRLSEEGLGWKQREACPTGQKG